MDLARVKRQLSEAQTEKLADVASDSELRKSVLALMAVMADTMSREASNRQVISGQESEIMYGLCRAEGARQLINNFRLFFEHRNKQEK